MVSQVAVITVDPRQLAAVAPKSGLAEALLSGLGGGSAARVDARVPLPSFVSPACGRPSAPAVSAPRS